MSGFRAVNSTLTATDFPPGKTVEETTPTTPRPNHFFRSDAAAEGNHGTDDPSAKTPTRDSFSGVLGQRPLPSAPFTPPSQERQDTPSTEPQRKSAVRENSHKSTKSLDSQDVDMEDDDDRDGSDNDSVTSDSTRPAKKKKGQRFFCTEFPPCQLSFTRSEHLARHIRKHTGERPFQCHCSRRFSRLDNLRQHAQTVHINEDIPGDSLAATGTRFQRQIRTDRVRPPASRSRASTLSTSSAHNRGHSRNLSTSSITSTTSTMSTVSQISTDDFRRRPAPLAIATTEAPQRAHLSLDTFNTSQLLGGSPGPTFYNPPGGRSPSGYSTPPSASYSSAQGSPRFSGLASPTSTTPRGVPLGTPLKTHARRLSVPSSGGNNPFQPHPGHQGYQHSSPLQSASGSAFQSNASSGYASPTTSVFSNSSDRRDSNADAEWRRRTWHPSTYTGMRPATSGLSQFQTPDSPDPAKAAPQQTMRLPGIESFDHAPPNPSLPRLGSPMQIDAPHQPPAEVGLQQGIRKLEIANPDSRNEQRPYQPTEWSQQTQAHYQALNPTQLPSLRRHEPPRAPHLQHHHNLHNSAYPPPVAQAAQPPVTQPPQNTSISFRYSDQPITSRQNKRHGWINGPLPNTLQSQEPPQTHPAAFPQHAPPAAAQASQPHGPPTQPFHSHSSSTGTIRTTPEDSSSSEGVPTPNSSNLGEWNPAIVRGDGYVDARPAHPSTLPTEEHSKISHGYEPKPDITKWSLQNAQMESRKRDREEHQRDSGVELSHGPPAGVDSGMRRLEALVAVATGEGRA